MKILHVAESAMGGVGSYLGELAPLQIAALGEANVRLIAPAAHAFQMGSLPAGSVIPYQRNGRSFHAMAALMRTVADSVEAFRPDMIHLHSTFAGMAVRGLYGWRRQRPRIVYCPHGWAFDVEAARWKRAAVAGAERAVGILCDRVIAISRHEALGARRVGFPLDRIDVVANGIANTPPPPAAAWNDDRLKVMFVGRLDRQKGFDTLLDAIVPLHKRVAVRVAGKAVAGHRMPSHGNDPVEYLGWLSREEIRGQLAAADVLVVPSRWEGFGLVAIEAMRAGRAVIASDVGGLREIVRHGETGWLVPPDDPAALGKALMHASRTPMDIMGGHGRARYLQAFTADRMHRQLLDVYDRCCVAPTHQPVPAWQ